MNEDRSLAGLIDDLRKRHYAWIQAGGLCRRVSLSEVLHFPAGRSRSPFPEHGRDCLLSTYFPPRVSATSWFQFPGKSILREVGAPMKPLSEKA